MRMHVSRSGWSDVSGYLILVLSRFDLFIYTACTVTYKDKKLYNVAFFNFDKHVSANYGKPVLRIPIQAVYMYVWSDIVKSIEYSFLSLYICKSFRNLEYDWWIVCCLSSNKKYFLNIHDVNYENWNAFNAQYTIIDLS
jgi:hypothetical protein